MITISENELPGLYQSAGEASADSQKNHYRMLGGYLSILILASIVSTYFSSTTVGAIIAALCFLASLGLLIAQKLCQQDVLWYNSRAVAESIKTRAWRWMMCADPYVHSIHIHDAKKMFIDDLKDILQKNIRVASLLPASTINSQPISSKMEQVRSLSVSERLEIYNRERIEDQATWYSVKAKYNRSKSKMWFSISVVLHISAIILLLIKISSPKDVFPIEIIAAVASCAMSWLQAKKHSELSASYSLTSHEIVLIKGECASILDEDALSNHIMNCESAFSREHTQWIARKNN